MTQQEHSPLSNTQHTIRILHLVGTIWFVAALVLLTVIILYQAGFQWWLIFSLSGHSLVFILFLVSFYVFALFRGIGSTMQNMAEHPLTSTHYYMTFYTSAPLIGGLAGFISLNGPSNLMDAIQPIIMGTLITTCLVWVFIDPLFGILEVLLPPGRHYRIKRIKSQKIIRQERHQRRQQLLEQVQLKEKDNHERWQRELQEYAQELTCLLRVSPDHYEPARQRAVEIGSIVWRYGSITCMRFLHRMVFNMPENAEQVDYITAWWDGIGTWRNPSCP